MKVRKAIITPDTLSSSYVTKSTNVASKMTEVLRLYVPRGVVWRIDPGDPFLLYLAHVETIASVGGAGDEVFETTNPPARVLDAARTHTDGLFQHVCELDSGVACPVLAVADHVDGGTHSITATVLGNEDHQVCYVPFVNGDVVVRAESPRGYGELAKPIFSSNIKALHARNQYLDNHLVYGGLLPPDYQLAVYVNSAVLLHWATGATAGAIDLPFARWRFSVWQFPESMFYKKGESDYGAALREIADSQLSGR